MEYYDMDNTNIMAELRILGDDFDVDEITNKLNIQPSEYWKRGDNIKRINKLRKYTCWIISTGYEESLDINIQLQKIMKKLEGKVDILKTLKDRYDLDYRLDLVINVEDNQSPEIFLNSDVISFANEIKAEFDFDLHIIS